MQQTTIANHAVNRFSLFCIFLCVAELKQVLLKYQ